MQNAVSATDYIQDELGEKPMQDTRNISAASNGIRATKKYNYVSWTRRMNMNKWKMLWTF
jgi:hypothetical protein